MLTTRSVNIQVVIYSYLWDTNKKDYIMSLATPLYINSQICFKTS